MTQQPRDAIIAESLSFQYGEAQERALKNLSFVLKEGGHLGVIGPSGAGKSTLMKLILRQYFPTGGELRVLGHKTEDWNSEALRRHITYVPQDTSLFHRSLRENIAYAKPEASEEELWKVIEKAALTKFIQELPSGIETLVGERGVKLSGGQRQRVAIARALLKDAPVIILDEATSALDSESEQHIQEGLKEVMAGKTVLAIAHRLSTLKEMNEVMVLESGEVSEKGNPQELLKDSASLFSQAWERQKGGFIGE